MVAAGALADGGNYLAAAGKAAGQACGVVLDGDRDVWVQVGVAVVADCGCPVAVDGCQVMVEVPVPAAARAIVGDALAQPVSLQQADRGFGVQDQAQELVAASFVIGGLVADKASTARAVAVLDVGRPSAWGTVGDVLPALRACPGQRRPVAPAAGEVCDRALGSREQQLRAGFRR